MSHEETAKRLLPCLCGPEERQQRGGHDDGCPAYYRFAVAAALAERDAEIERLKTLLHEHTVSATNENAQLRAERDTYKRIAERNHKANLMPCPKCGHVQDTIHAAEIEKGGKMPTVTLEQFAKDYPCHCAERYPGSTAYHGHDCENATVQEFVARFAAEIEKMGKK
jgi:hypothetical protein